MLDRDVVRCARYHVDKHVVKMITEHNQLMSTACHLLGLGSPELYKLTHKNHPAAVWVRGSREHFEFLLELTRQLELEFQHRFKKPHAGSRLFSYLGRQVRRLPSNGWVDPPQCMPDDCKADDVVQAYRTYYRRYKRHIARWKFRDIPAWFLTEGENHEENQHVVF